MIAGLKNIYHKKIEPVEKTYEFQAFHSPLMVKKNIRSRIFTIFFLNWFTHFFKQQDGDFDSKPMVLFLGQYSTGKTTFIEYLLERSFPGSHIGKKCFFFLPFFFLETKKKNTNY